MITNPANTLNAFAPPPVMTSDQILGHLDQIHQGLPDPVRAALDHAHGLTGGQGSSVSSALKPSPAPSPQAGSGIPLPGMVGATAHDIGGVPSPVSTAPADSIAPPPVSDVSRETSPIPGMVGVNENDIAPAPGPAMPLPLRGPQLPYQMNVANPSMGQTHQGEFDRLTAPPLPGGDPNSHTKMDTGRSGIDQIHNPWLRTLGTIGDVVASGLFPRLGQFIPGTSAHHGLLVNQAEGALAEDQAGAKSAAEVAKESAQTDEAKAHIPLMGAQANEANATAAAKLNPPDPKEWEEVKSGPVIDPDHPEIGPQVMYVNKNDPSQRRFMGVAAAKPTEDKTAASVHVLPDGSVVSVNHDTKTGKSTAEVVYKGDPKIATEVKQLEIGGKPHQVLVNSQTGATIKDLGETGEKPPVINLNAETHQEQMKGKELLDKAEGAYRTAVQSAGSLGDFVKAARSGNKVAAEAIPLEGALNITTAQGVHRINRNEIDQVAGAGNLFDRIMGRVGKLTTGQPIPPDVQKDFEDLSMILQRGAYKTYKDAHTSAVKRYGLNGETPLSEPGGTSGTSVVKKFNPATGKLE